MLKHLIKYNNMMKLLNLKQKDILVIFGPTAVGKNDVAIKYAEKYNGVIINADSAQVYKQCSSLTNIPEYHENIDHFLYSFLNINDDFSVGKWLLLVNDLINSAFAKNKLPIVVGGSGMYISSLLYGISPMPSNLKNKHLSIRTYEELGEKEFFKLVEKIDPETTNKFQDPQRLIRAYEVYLSTQTPFSELQKLPKKQIINGNFINLYLYKDRNKLYNNINERTHLMIKNGAIDEVKNTISIIDNAEQYLKKILGATDIVNYLNHTFSIEDTINIIQKKTRNYAKRQITWFNNQIKDKETQIID